MRHVILRVEGQRLASVTAAPWAATPLRETWLASAGAWSSDAQEALKGTRLKEKLETCSASQELKREESSASTEGRRTKTALMMRSSTIGAGVKSFERSSRRHP